MPNPAPQHAADRSEHGGGRSSRGADLRRAQIETAADGGLVVHCPCCESTLLLERIVLSPVQPVEPPTVVHLEIPGDGSDIEHVIDALKLRLVRRAMQEAEGVKSRAARALGLKYSTFWELVQRLGLAEAGSDDGSSRPRPPHLLDAGRLVLHLRDDAGPCEVRIEVDGESRWRHILLETKLALAQRALDRADGNAVKAAKLAAMKYTTFYALARRLRQRRSLPSS